MRARNPKTLPVAPVFNPLPTTHYPLPTTHYPLPTTHYPLPTTHYPLPTTHYPLPTTHYPLSPLMTQSIILGIGAGRCGLRSLTTLLNQQPEVQASYRELPFLTWRVADGERIIKARFARFRNTGRGRILGDVAPFYSALPGDRHCRGTGHWHRLPAAVAGKGRRPALRVVARIKPIRCRRQFGEGDPPPSRITIWCERRP